jgi:CO dehydrogenase/acetyl-CoA synthase delta subunit
MNSLSSPYLLKHAPVPASKTVSPRVEGCDDLCQSLKKALEARVNAFEDIRTVKSDGGASGTTVKLGGAKGCTVKEAAEPSLNQIGTQFVCYWRETSGSAAEKRFRDLVSRLQVLIPSNWSTHQETETDDFTGADMTAWHAVEPGGKHDVRVYVSAESIGLHITAWN